MLSRRWMRAAMLAMMMAVPALALAHDGPHKVIGTVTAVRGNQVEVRTTAGKKEVVVLGASVPVTRGTARAAIADVKVGERVSIDCTDQKGVMTAQKVQLGTVATTARR